MRRPWRVAEVIRMSALAVRASSSSVAALTSGIKAKTASWAARGWARFCKGSRRSKTLLMVAGSFLSALKRQLNALASAEIGVPGKGERRGSKGACVPLDGVNGASLRRARALQGRERRGLSAR
jgi:hypothetical protein